MARDGMKGNRRPQNDPDPLNDPHDRTSTPDGSSETIEREDRSEDRHPSCPVVGVGASAGGLEAIQGLLSHFPDAPDLAIVVIQHRAHDRKSMMASLLARHTRMAIEELSDGAETQPNRIYLGPADKDVSIMNGALYCTEPAQHKGPPLPIDHFFRSLARDQAERAVGIVLSGTGSDGTLGIKEIKASGGMAMVQDPKQAHYDQMPRNAIDTGLIDHVRPVEEMAGELIGYLKHPYMQRPPAQDAEKKFESQLQKVFLTIRQETGHDFSHYKRNTIKRRIARRLAVHQIENIDTYIRYLGDNPSEARTLSKELLITVTGFFRDREAFDSLSENVIRPLIENRPANAPVRVWVPGCATGEEAYSIAILIYEQMRESNKLHDVQVFGTDLDGDAIERARYGRYPKSIAGDLSTERLGQFFSEEDNHYRVKTHIREMLVFAAHNLIREPPFSRLDLISCRNVLIYMNSTLQQKLLPLFQYALHPGGVLFLGESESIGTFADLFEPVDARHRIFRRKKGQADYETGTPGFHFPVQRSQRSDESTRATDRRMRDVSGLVEKVILREYSVPCVLIDQVCNVLYFNGDTSPYLAQPGGQPTLNLLHMARPEVHHKLAGLIKRAASERRKVIERNAPVGVDEHHSGTDITIRPIREFESQDGCMLVVFRPRLRDAATTDQDSHLDQRPNQEKDARIEALEQELQSTREYLQTTIEELETSNEELKSANEELQSTNEELQSTNEELDTSREELQSTNEELRSVNTEHQARIAELSKARDDMNNLLGCTEIATLFLDKEMKIRLFTPAARRLFRLIERDIDRPLEDITTVIEYDDFARDLVSVFDTLKRIEKEILVGGDTWYLMRIVPYRSRDNVIQGVVATFIDITRQKQATLAMQQRDFAEAVVHTVRQPLLVLDAELRVMLANRAFYKTFEVAPEDTDGRLVYELGDRQWDIPRLRELLEKIVPQNSGFDGFVIEHDFPRIGRRKMTLNARQTARDKQQTGNILLAFDDVTEAGANANEREQDKRSQDDDG